MHMANPAQVEKLIGAMPTLGAGNVVVPDTPPSKDGEISLNAEQLGVAKALGIDPKAYAETLKGRARDRTLALSPSNRINFQGTRDDRFDFRPQHCPQWKAISRVAGAAAALIYAGALVMRNAAGYVTKGATRHRLIRLRPGRGARRQFGRQRRRSRYPLPPWHLPLRQFGVRRSDRHYRNRQALLRGR